MNTTQKSIAKKPMIWDSPTRIVHWLLVLCFAGAWLAPQALAKEQRVEMDSDGACRIKSQPALIGILLRNVIDNAIRYSPPGASIRLTLKTNGAPAIQVEDSGPGLSADDQSKLGQRFFRVLGSEESGCGLGWSIIRRVAQSQNLEIITGKSKDLGGFRVMLKWPSR